MSDAVSWAIWSNIFLGLGFIIWAKTLKPEYGFAVVALGIILQYFYNIWGKWIGEFMKK